MVCRGFGRSPNSNAVDALINRVPGVVLKDAENFATADDLYQDNTCEPDDKNMCMDQCVGDFYSGMENNPPAYSWIRDNATQCNASNKDIVNTCKQQCHVQ